MKPSHHSNRADYGALDWYGHRHRGGGRGFVFAVFGNLTAAFDGDQLFIRIGHAGRRTGADGV